MFLDKLAMNKESSPFERFVSKRVLPIISLCNIFAQGEEKYFRVLYFDCSSLSSLGNDLPIKLVFSLAKSDSKLYVLLIPMHVFDEAW